MTTTSAAPTIADDSFEDIALGDSNQAYDPVDPDWDFQGQAGVAAGGSDSGSANPPAPDGDQVAFVQGTGSIQQVIPGWVAGSYQVTFQAAQSPENQADTNQDIQVLLDGSPIATITPSDDTYWGFATPTFAISTGTHILSFRGLDTTGADDMASIDDIQVGLGLLPISLTPAVADTSSSSEEPQVLDDATEYTVPTANSQPTAITSGSDGDLWFTETNANKIGKLDPQTGEITEYPLPPTASTPWDIIAGPDGNIWFTSLAGRALGCIDPKTGNLVSLRQLPSFDDVLGLHSNDFYIDPARLTIGPDGNIWFSISMYYPNDIQAVTGCSWVGEIDPFTRAIAS